MKEQKQSQKQKENLNYKNDKQHLNQSSANSKQQSKKQSNQQKPNQNLSKELQPKPKQQELVNNNLNNKNVKLEKEFRVPTKQIFFSCFLAIIFWVIQAAIFSAYLPSYVFAFAIPFAAIVGLFLRFITPKLRYKEYLKEENNAVYSIKDDKNTVIIEKNDDKTEINTDFNINKK